eukprot:TRINITY_DN4912_c0_g2_i1.p1 TRINITY_DN4912_c0_g2~~TRINITY_DN4912_c0_g2_i1.p1  ORF type:complete len:154 (-),score=28.19 TRINITY_DN4912_c0_g2_i1:70-531(-)
MASTNPMIEYPKLWTKPRCKIYDMNRLYGEYYYQPMLEYIDNQDLTGGLLTKSQPVKLVTLLAREPIKLPHGHEMTSGNIIDLPVGAPRLEPFLAKYRAQQIKEANMKTAHVRSEMIRASRNVNTLPDKKTSTLIRNQYLREISHMHMARVFD